MEQRYNYQGTPSRPSFGEMVGFYAYMFAVGGGLPDRRFFSTVVRRPELIDEITRPESDISLEEDGVIRAA